MTPKDLIIWTTRRAKTAHNAFMRYPSAQNWRETVESMLVYQQAEWLIRNKREVIGIFLLKLEAADPQLWPTLICEEAGACLELVQ